MTFFLTTKRINFINPFYFNPNNVIRLAILLTLFSLYGYSKTDEIKIKSFALCWETKLQNVSSQPLLSQSDRVFVTLGDGSVVALNITNGSTSWRADLGGTIVGPAQASSNALYIASQATALDQSKTPIIIIRSLSINTGVTIWQKEFPAASRASLIIQNNFLLIALTDENKRSSLYAVKALNGQDIWSQKLATAIVSNLVAQKSSFYFATEDNLLWIHNLTDGTILQRWPLPHAANNQIALQGDLIFFSDSTGYISALRETNKKSLWTLRLGAGVQNILLIDDKILISSFDDFIYFHKIENGKRLWRKRFASRPLGVSMLSDSATVGLTVSGEPNGTIINLKKGKSIDLLNLGQDNEALSAPFFFNNYLIILTKEGLKSFSDKSSVCPKTEQKADNN